VSLFVNSTFDDVNAGVSCPWLRQAHAKAHGCVQAIVTPVAGLDPSLAVGAFASPNPIAAFSRFSNGAGHGFLPRSSPVDPDHADYIPDVRGFGIKLMNVSGPFIISGASSQVFHLITDSVGFLEDLDDAQGFFEAVQSGVASLGFWAFKNPRLAALLAGAATIISDLLTTDWHAPVVNQHGSLYVRHQITPANQAEALSRIDYSREAQLNSDYLHDQLVSDLSGGYGVTLNWGVQVYVDEDSTPLNDATQSWDVGVTPLATIHIPAQSFSSEGQNNMCAFMAFNPAMSMAEHQPYGDIQDLRKAVYTAMAQQRHKFCGQPNNDVTYNEWLAWPKL